MYEEIKKKSEYCLNCKAKPCSNKGCPLNNNIPEFIKYIREENYQKAYDVLSKTTILPAICGRICPHFKQCMGACIRGIKGDPVSIGKLESFVGDIALEKGFAFPKINNNSHKKNVAIIGGGPAGLTSAAFLAMNGNKVTIYEKYDYLGGLLMHGIPDFRLSKNIIKKTIDKVLELGIDVKYNQELGKNIHLDELEKDYDNIILAFGSNSSLKMGIDGENLNGVYGANELLEFNNHPNYEGKTVIVNGGGNVAMDVARTIKRLGAKKVIVVYRRSREQMPAEQNEINDAINEDVEFLFQNRINRIIGENIESDIKNEENLLNGNSHVIRKVELIKTNLVQKGTDSRPFPVDIEGSNYEINADFVVMAIGSKPAKFVDSLGLELNPKGFINVNENGQTSNPKIYAIGDLAGNTATVAWAARSGRNVAEFLSKQ